MFSVRKIPKRLSDVPISTTNTLVLQLRYDRHHYYVIIIIITTGKDDAMSSIFIRTTYEYIDYITVSLLLICIVTLENSDTVLITIKFA